MSLSTTTTTINNLPNELLELISISAGPAEYCNLRHAIKPLWLYTTGNEDHCLKQFLVTKVDRHGNTITTLCGKRHSMFDQPAFICSHRSYGEKMWYKHGHLHRDGDLPAQILCTGTQFWYQHNHLHRDGDQPAEIYADGTKYWFKHGVKYTP